MQTWGTGLTFVPDMNFLEFIPEDELDKSRKEPGYQPRTLLLDQVTPGSIYEIVVTNFHGGTFVRYRLGDLIKIIALGNEKAGIRIPQMIFHSRADDIIDLGGFARLTERTDFPGAHECEGGLCGLDMYQRDRRGKAKAASLHRAEREQVPRAKRKLGRLFTKPCRTLIQSIAIG